MPFTFTDSKNREWDVTLNLAAAKRIDSIEDISEFYTGKPFSFLEPTKDMFLTILSSRGLLFAMIYAVVYPQVKEKLNLDPRKPEESDQAQELFAEGIDGPTIEKGREAFWGSLGDFFPSHKTVLSILIKEIDRIEAKMTTMVAGKEAELQTLMDDLLAKAEKTMDKEMKTLASEVGEKLPA